MTIRQLLFWFFLSAFLLVIPGCGTHSTLDLSSGPIFFRAKFFAEQHTECESPNDFLNIPHVYSGIKKDFIYLTYPFACGWDRGGEIAFIETAIYFLVYPLVVLDLPFSFVADTVMLVKTIPKQIKEGSLIDPPYFKIGQNYQQAGNEIKALEYFEKGIAVLPKYFGNRPYYKIDVVFQDYLEDSIEWLAKYYEKKGNLNQAVFFYDYLLEIGLLNGATHGIHRYHEYLRKIYSKLGDQERANQYFTEGEKYRTRANL